MQEAAASANASQKQTGTGVQAIGRRDGYLLSSLHSHFIKVVPSTAISCTDHFDGSQKGVRVAALLEGHWTPASRQLGDMACSADGHGDSKSAIRFIVDDADTDSRFNIIDRHIRDRRTG